MTKSERKALMKNMQKSLAIMENMTEGDKTGIQGRLVRMIAAILMYLEADQ